VINALPASPFQGSPACATRRRSLGWTPRFRAQEMRCPTLYTDDGVRLYYEEARRLPDRGRARIRGRTGAAKRRNCASSSGALSTRCHRLQRRGLFPPYGQCPRSGTAIRRKRTGRATTSARVIDGLASRGACRRHLDGRVCRCAFRLRPIQDRATAALVVAGCGLRPHAAKRQQFQEETRAPRRRSQMERRGHGRGQQDLWRRPDAGCSI